VDLISSVGHPLGKVFYFAFALKGVLYRQNCGPNKRLFFIADLCLFQQLSQLNHRSLHVFNNF
jgi:hypothetical protein